MLSNIDILVLNPIYGYGIFFTILTVALITMITYSIKNRKSKVLACSESHANDLYKDSLSGNYCCSECFSSDIYKDSLSGELRCNNCSFKVRKMKLGKE